MSNPNKVGGTLPPGGYPDIATYADLPGAPIYSAPVMNEPLDTGPSGSCPAWFGCVPFLDETLERYT